MSLLALFLAKGKSGFGYASTAEQVTEGLDLSGKSFLLTGCNSGLGFETLRVLGLRGAHVIAAARSDDKATQAIAAAGLRVGENATPVVCDLSEPSSVRACVKQVRALERPLDGILCNAGIMALPKLELAHGYELQFLTNHIGHFLLVTGLLDQLSESGRVVMTSSLAHRQAPKVGIDFDNLRGELSYNPWQAYGRAKLANLLFAKQLAKNFAGSGRSAYALHPGVIQTGLGRHLNPVMNIAMKIAAPLFFKSIAQGAATQCYLATQPGIENLSGQYFADCNLAKSTPQAQNEALAAELWQVSERIAVGLG